jgi:hypothetical protein
MTATALWDEAIGRLRSLGAQWASFTLIGSFVLYVLGYLTVRFHLTVLGAGTDLGIVDERYLFAGARFVVYLVSACVTLLLLLLLPAAAAWVAWRLRRGRAKQHDKAAHARSFDLSPASQTAMLLFGIVLAILVIQVVMKQCFFFANLLLQPEPPAEAKWLFALAAGPNDALLALYFVGLVASVAVTGGLLVLAGRTGGAVISRALFWLLAFLVAVQILLLPINYGTLIADKSLPKVRSLDGVTPLRSGEEAWLVWEGSNGLTYFVRRAADSVAPRALVTLNRKDVKQMEILGYDRILKKAFGGT